MATTSYAAPAPTLLAQLAQPSAAYKRRVWLAAASLACFVTLYFLLAAWFLYTAYRTFIDRVRRSELPAAEQALNIMPPYLRGQAYSIGVIVLGARAPAAWRRGAKRLLFASERPYFN